MYPLLPKTVVKCGCLLSVISYRLIVFGVMVPLSLSLTARERLSYFADTSRYPLFRAQPVRLAPDVQSGGSRTVLVIVIERT